MKLTINAEELKGWDVCEDGLSDFMDMHSDKTVSLKDALESNGTEDLLSAFFDNKEHFVESQIKDAKLLLCDYADHVLHIFEEKYPDNNAPRTCIETTRKYINGECSKAGLIVAKANAVVVGVGAVVVVGAGAVNAVNAVVSAANAAVCATGDAAYATTYATGDAAYATTYSTAYATGGAAYATAFTTAAYSAANAAKEKELIWQKRELIKLIEKWEND